MGLRLLLNECLYVQFVKKLNQVQSNSKWRQHKMSHSLGVECASRLRWDNYCECKCKIFFCKSDVNFHMRWTLKFMWWRGFFLLFLSQYMYLVCAVFCQANMFLYQKWSLWKIYWFSNCLNTQWNFLCVFWDHFFLCASIILNRNTQTLSPSGTHFLSHQKFSCTFICHNAVSVPATL